MWQVEVATRQMQSMGETFVKGQGQRTMEDKWKPCKGDRCPPQRCHQHRRSHSTRLRTARTEAGVTSVLRRSDANGLITTVAMDEGGVCQSSIWIMHS